VENKQINYQAETAKEQPAKRKYLAGVGIIKAVICAVAFIALTKYANAPIFIAAAVVALLGVDIIMIALIRKRGMQLSVGDALLVNLVAVALFGLGFCYEVAIDAMAHDYIIGVTLPVIIALIVVGAIFQTLFVLTMIVIHIMSKKRSG